MYLYIHNAFFDFYFFFFLCYSFQTMTKTKKNQNCDKIFQFVAKIFYCA
jgi:hypothetical protein